MATLSSHLLNSMDGTHAGNVTVSVVQIAPDGLRQEILNAATDSGGRFAEQIPLGDADAECEFEMVIDSAAYFAARGQQPDTARIISHLIVRFRMADPDGKYHIPLMIAPNSYSVWWSS